MTGHDPRADRRGGAIVVAPLVALIVFFAAEWALFSEAWPNCDVYCGPLPNVLWASVLAIAACVWLAAAVFVVVGATQKAASRRASVLAASLTLIPPLFLVVRALVVR